MEAEAGAEAEREGGVAVLEEEPPTRDNALAEDNDEGDGEETALEN
jgi:hypothetical protein